MAWSGSRFVSVGNGVLMHSADGATWAATSGASERVVGAALNGVTWGATRFVAVGGTSSGSSVIAYSTDGVTWTTTSGAFDNAFLTGVTWNGTRFVAVGGRSSGSSASNLTASGMVLHSADGVTWTAASGALDGAFLNAVTWNGTRFVAVGGTWSWSPSESTFDVAPVVVHSTDGVTWTDASGTGTLDDSSYLRGVTWGGGRFVAVGQSDASGRATIVHSADGVTWTDASGADALDDASYLRGVTWGNGVFVAVGTGSDIVDTNTGEESPRGAMIMRSTDGDTWSAVSRAGALAGSLRGVTWGGTRFVAVGEGADGWTILTSP